MSRVTLFFVLKGIARNQEVKYVEKITTPLDMYVVHPLPMIVALDSGFACLVLFPSMAASSFVLATQRGLIKEIIALLISFLICRRHKNIIRDDAVKVF